jgi:PAS domain S-box-containing protein
MPAIDQEERARIHDLLEQQRRDREQLQASEERYRAFIANSSEGIWCLEFDPPLDTRLPVEQQVEQAYRHGRLVECNDAMARMYGLRRAADLRGKQLGFMLAKSATAREYIATIVRAGYRVSNLESVERNAAGEPVYFINNLVGSVERGRLLRIWGTQQNITERKRAEEALRTSETRYRTLFNSIDEGFAVIELIYNVAGAPVDYRFLEVNAAFERHTGLVRATGRRIREISSQHEEHWFQTYGRVAQTGQAIRFQSHAAALRRWFDVYAFRLDPPGSRRVALLFTDITERTRAYDAKARLAAIVEFSEDAIVSKDVNGIITSWNRGAERLFGYRTTEAIGQPITMIIPPERRAEETSILDRIRRRQPTEHYETVRRRKDGRLLDISLTVSPITDAAGEVVGASKIARDVTERKQAEEILKRRAAAQTALYQLTDRLNRATSRTDIYNAALDSLLSAIRCDRAAVLLFDAAGVMQFVADRGLSEEYRDAVRGHSPWSPDARNPEPVCISDVEQDDFAMLREVVKREGIRALAFIPITGGGKLTGKFMIYYNAPHDFSRAEMDLARTIAWQLGFGLERQHAEKALRESESRFRTLVEQVKDYAIFSMDNQGRPTSWNEGVARVFSFPEREFIGQDVAPVIFTPEDIAAGVPQEELRRAADTGTANSSRWMRRKDGTRFYASGVTTGLRNEAGEPIGFSKVVRDQTSAKLTEEALAEARARLQQYAQNLEQTVADRTRALRETNEQLEAFVYSIAHDLRAPLRAMTGFSQLLVDGYTAQLDESAQDLLRRIQQSSEFMDHLLMDLLAYGRAAQAEMELAPVDVHKAWEAALFLCRAQLEQTQAHVEVIEPLPVVRAHESTLGQCLANLLSNALKFVAPGTKPYVRFRAEEHDQVARLWLEDNGIGIPPDQRERVFRVFERLHGARYVGTGIGLSIVRKGIERMGGAVGLNSTPDQGSRFWIELPRAK